jgi:hypothetical protein
MVGLLLRFIPRTTAGPSLDCYYNKNYGKRGRGVDAVAGKRAGAVVSGRYFA